MADQALNFGAQQGGGQFPHGDGNPRLIIVSRLAGQGLRQGGGTKQQLGQLSLAASQKGPGRVARILALQLGLQGG